MNRTLDRHGESITVINYTDSGTRDEYENINYDTVSTETKGIFEVTRQPLAAQTPVAETVDVDANIYVSSDINIIDTSESSKPSEVIRQSTGHTYEIEFKFEEGAGITWLKGVRR